MKNKLSQHVIAKYLMMPRCVKTDDVIDEMINASIKERTLYVSEQMKIFLEQYPMLPVVSLLANAVIARIACKSMIETAKRKQVNT